VSERTNDEAASERAVDRLISRRDFALGGALGLLGLATGLPRMAEGAKPVTRPYPLRRVFGGITPKESHGGPLKLPPWQGDDSFAKGSVLMFRGSPSHTHYGTGPLPDRLKVRWTHRMIDFKTKLRGRPITWKGTGWTGQPVVHGGYVFVGSVGCNLYAFETATGKLRWRLEGGRMFKSSPCLYQNRLYLGSVDNLLRCIDAATGKVLWAAWMGGDNDSSPCVVDDKLYICGETGHARCLDPRTGKLQWETYLGGTGRGTKPGSNGVETSPAVVDGELFAGSYDGRLFCVDIKSGRIKWTAKTHDDTDVSPVVVGNHVYIAAEDRASRLYCFDRRRKGKLVWQYEGNPSGYWSTPAYADGKLYIGGQDGLLHCVDAATGRGLWTYRTEAPIWSSPAHVGGRLVFGSYDQHLHLVDAASGRGIHKLRLDGRCISTPAVVDGRVYVGTATGTFYCVG